VIDLGSDHCRAQLACAKAAAPARSCREQPGTPRLTGNVPVERVCPPCVSFFLPALRSPEFELNYACNRRNAEAQMVRQPPVRLSVFPAVNRRARSALVADHPYAAVILRVPIASATIESHAIEHDSNRPTRLGGKLLGLAVPRPRHSDLNSASLRLDCLDESARVFEPPAFRSVTCCTAGNDLITPRHGGQSHLDRRHGASSGKQLRSRPIEDDNWAAPISSSGAVTTVFGQRLSLPSGSPEEVSHDFGLPCGIVCRICFAICNPSPPPRRTETICLSKYLSGRDTARVNITNA